MPLSICTIYSRVQNCCPDFSAHAQRTAFAAALGKHFTRLLSPPKKRHVLYCTAIGPKRVIKVLVRFLDLSMANL